MRSCCVCRADETCLDAWHQVHRRRPGWIRKLLNDFCRHPHSIQDLKVRARLLGKSTCKPKLGEIRAILLLPPLLSIADTIIAQQMSKWAADAFELDRGIYFGCGAGTQVTDITHRLALGLAAGREHSGAFLDVTKEILRPSMTKLILSGSG